MDINTFSLSVILLTYRNEARSQRTSCSPSRNSPPIESTLPVTSALLTVQHTAGNVQAFDIVVYIQQFIIPNHGQLMGPGLSKHFPPITEGNSLWREELSLGVSLIGEDYGVLKVSGDETFDEGTGRGCSEEDEEEEGHSELNARRVQTPCKDINIRNMQFWPWWASIEERKCG